jgi:hypothetical protein
MKPSPVGRVRRAAGTHRPAIGISIYLLPWYMQCLSFNYLFPSRTTTMGLFWDLIQQSQISDQQSSTASLEDRVDRLEAQLHEVQQLQLTLLKTLEKHFGQDIDGDGHVG